MAEEIDAATTSEAAPAEVAPAAEEEFDWGQFFLDKATEAGGPPPEPVAAPVAAPVSAGVTEEDEEADDVDILRAKIADLEKVVTRTQATTQQIEQSTRVSTAIEAWKAQASPAELAMADVLSEARTPEDLKLRAEVIKRATAQQDKLAAQQREQIEREMQKQFGLPVTPTFQPVPEKEKMKQALAEGDIDAAAALAMKGFFNT